MPDYIVTANVMVGPSKGKRIKAKVRAANPEEARRKFADKTRGGPMVSSARVEKKGEHKVPY